MNQLATAVRLAVGGAEPQLTSKARAAFVGIDPDALVEVALAHRVAPWLLKALTSDGTPPVDVEPLAAVARAQVLQTLNLYGELQMVLRELGEVNADVIVLKGADFAEGYYPDPALRAYGDIDLLIHEADLPRAAQLLMARGYAEYNEAPTRDHHHHGLFQHIFLHETKPLTVELHADHLQIGVRPVELDQLWARAPEAPFAPGLARVLEPHDLFVLGCVHLHRHGFNRLMWFKDLDLMVRNAGLDWSLVRERAIEEGCLSSVAYTLDLLAAVLDVPLAEGARTIISERSLWTRGVQRVLWPRADVLELKDQRKWRLRRAMQFSPESGFVRGALPSLFVGGRRREKLEVMVGRFTGRPGIKP